MHHHGVVLARSSPGAALAAARARFDGSRAAGFAFILIFPGFVTYQSLVDRGFFPPVLGGFFTSACVMALPFLLVGLATFPRGLDGPGRLIGLTFAAFMALFGVRIILGVLAGADTDITGSHAAFFVKFIVLYLVGRMINPFSPQMHRLLMAAFAGISAFVLGTLDAASLLLAELARQMNDEFQLDYQGMGHAFLMLTLFCLPPLERVGRVAIYFVSLPVLVVVGARSELVAFFLAVMLVEGCKAPARSLFVAGVGSVAMLALGAFLVLAPRLPDHRVFQLLTLSADESAQERSGLTIDALRTISENPLWGAYASYESGHYAHNILSAWVDLGLPGFIVLIILLAIPVFALLRRFRQHGRDDFYVLVLICTMGCVLLVASAKTYTYQMIPIVVGLYSRYSSLCWSARATSLRGAADTVSKTTPR